MLNLLAQYQGLENYQPIAVVFSEHGIEIKLKALVDKEKWRLKASFERKKGVFGERIAYRMECALEEL